MKKYLLNNWHIKITTISLIKDVDVALTICAELGINAITTCMWNVNGWLAEKLGLHVTSHEFDKNEWTVN